MASKLKPIPIHSFKEFCRETRQRWKPGGEEGKWTRAKAKVAFYNLVFAGKMGWGSDRHMWDFQMYEYVGGEK